MNKFFITVTDQKIWRHRKKKLSTASLFLYSFVNYTYKALEKEGVAHF
jgi:hypothetical protein